MRKHVQNQFEENIHHSKKPARAIFFPDCLAYAKPLMLVMDVQMSIS